MQQKVSDPRVARMFGGDRSWAVVALIALWALYAFVFYEVKDRTTTPEVFWALAVSGGLVLLFNTAAIIAMLSNLGRDRDEIYGLDLHYLDISKKN